MTGTDGRIQGARTALAAEPSLREKKMFSGVSLMVYDQMLLSVMRNDNLRLRLDPQRVDALMTVRGAGAAEMGARADAPELDHGRPPGR